MAKRGHEILVAEIAYYTQLESVEQPVMMSPGVDVGCVKALLSNIDGLRRQAK